jgi:hypothetical protein
VACIGNSNAILPMITVAGVPPFHSDEIEAEQLIERQIRRDIQYRLILRQNTAHLFIPRQPAF